MTTITTGLGPSRAGCHDLPEVDVQRFWDLGGEDIQVWDTDYTIKGTRESAEYVASVIDGLTLDCDD